MGDAALISNPAFFLTDRDKSILATPDNKYVFLTWDKLKEAIESNRLEDLTRSPPQLRAYLTWSASTKLKYGTITKYLLSERLHWEPLNPDLSSPPRFDVRSTVPFESKEDYLVLLNDWPYGLAEDITHICVWLKTPLEVSPEDGALTERGTEVVERFVRKTFVERLVKEGLSEDEARDKVLWFKNWTGLQSVRGVEHVHVLVRDVRRDIIEEWTKEDK